MKKYNNSPRLVLCAGLHRSGSTWLYNATLMLMKSVTNSVGLYSDELSIDVLSHLKTETPLVIKCHKPDARLAAVGNILSAPLILSVRDPRDCIVSLETAFSIERDRALRLLKESGLALLQLTDYPQQLVIKYEECVDQLQTLKRVASVLGIAASDELIDKLLEALNPEAIKAKVSVWESEGVLDKSRPVHVWTEESHWHANHCGDGLSGKYVDYLSPRESASVENQMRSFFDAFGYDSDDPLPIESGQLLKFNDEGMFYAVEGFSTPEEWGIWTEQLYARIALPLRKSISRFRLEMSLVKPLSFNGAIAKLFINGGKVTDLFPLDGPSEILLIYDGELNSDRIKVEFRFENLASPQSLGINSDDRLLGVGVKNLKVSYL